MSRDVGSLSLPDTFGLRDTGSARFTASRQSEYWDVTSRYQVLELGYSETVTARGQCCGVVSGALSLFGPTTTITSSTPILMTFTMEALTQVERWSIYDSTFKSHNSRKENAGLL